MEATSNKINRETNYLSGGKIVDNKDLYEAITEMRRDMNAIKEETARTGAQMDFLLEDYKKMDDYNRRLTSVESSVDRAQKRHDSADKWRFAIGTGLLGTIITTVINIIANTN